MFFVLSSEKSTSYYGVDLVNQECWIRLWLSAGSPLGKTPHTKITELTWLQTEIGSPAHSDPEHLTHVKGLGVGTIRKRPIEVVQEARQCELHGCGREQSSRTLPAPSSEWDELDVCPLVLRRAARKPLWPELVGLVPVFWVPRNCEGVDEDGGTLGYVVAHDPAVFLAGAKDQRSGWT